MSKPDSWMAFYPAAYLADTMHLTRDQHGGYLLLLLAAWNLGGKLPANDKTLAAITKSSPKEWKELKPVLEVFFSIQGDCWIQKRLNQELDKAQKRYQTKVENGAKGGRPRHPDKTEPKPAGYSNDNLNVTEQEPGGLAKHNRPGSPSGERTETQYTKNKEPNGSFKTLTPLSDLQSDDARQSEKKQPNGREEQAIELLDFLNAKTGHHYRPTVTTLKPIIARLKDGFTPQECRAVIVRKWRQWKDNDEMKEYLRPETLFGDKKFSQYIGQVPPPTEDENAVP